MRRGLLTQPKRLFTQEDTKEIPHSPGIGSRVRSREPSGFKDLAPVAVVEYVVDAEPFSWSRTCCRRRSVLVRRETRPAVLSWDMLLEVSRRPAPIRDDDSPSDELNEDLRAGRPAECGDSCDGCRYLEDELASWDMLRDIRLLLVPPSAVGDERDEDRDSRVRFSSSWAWRRSRSMIALMCSPLRRRGWASWSRRVIEKARPTREWWRGAGAGVCECVFAGIRSRDEVFGSVELRLRTASARLFCGQTITRCKKKIRNQKR